MTVDPSPYWSTVAQLCPLFGAAVVIEARRFIMNTSQVPRRFRIAQGVVLAGAAASLVAALNHALGELASDHETLDGAPLVNFLLSIIATALIFNPVADAVWASNADSALAVRFALRHPVMTVDVRFTGWRNLVRTRKVVVSALGNLEGAESNFETALNTARKAVAVLDWWTKFKDMPGAEAAAVAVPRPKELEGLNFAEITAKEEADERECWGLVGDTAEVIDRAWTRLVAALELLDDVVEAYAERDRQYNALMAGVVEKSMADLRERIGAAERSA